MVHHIERVVGLRNESKGRLQTRSNKQKQTKQTKNTRVQIVYCFKTNLLGEKASMTKKNAINLFD